MTQVSSLPVWATILILGTISLILLGYFSPYVPKSVKLMLLNVDREDWSKPRPTVLIRDRVPATLAVVLTILVPFAALVVFIAMDSWRLIQHLGGGFFWGFVVYAVAFLSYGVAMILDFVLFASANYAATKSIRRHYERHYGAKIVIESPKY